MCIISLVINLKYLVDSINNYSDDEYNLFLNLIKDTKKKEIIKIKDFNVRKRKILGEILLIKLLDSVNINYDDISINKNEFGKPYLDCGIFFNISHSNRYMLISHCGFDLHFPIHAEYIMRNAGLEEAQAGIKIARRNINKPQICR